MQIEKVIEGRAFINGELSYAEIGISEGKIVSVGKMARGGDERMDVGTSKIILPGFIDPTYFQGSGDDRERGFHIRYLICGPWSVTCILDMPNTNSCVRSDALMSKKSTVRKKAHVDYGLFAAVTPGSKIGMMAPYVPGFKLFMGSTTGNILMNDDDEISQVVRDIKITKKRLSVHAEDDRMILRDAERSTRDHLRNRPAEAEHNAIRRLGRYSGSRINICHNTNVESLDLASSYGFTTEVTLHHLLFDVDRNTTAEYKVNPPIRDPDTRDKLWKAFISGRATMFGSDHAPHTLSEKSQDFDSAPGWIPGVETTMPIVMNMVRKEVLPLSQAVIMGAENPGKAFDMRKGKIAVGYDADFSIFDLRKVTKVDIRKLHSKAGHSPYVGMDAIFPDTVMIRGDIQIKTGVLR